MSEFFVGQKVVCINSDWHPVSKWRQFLETVVGRKVADPIDGEIYTISEFDDPRGDKIYFALAELDQDESWEAACFRPLQSYSIEIFRQIARDVTEGKKVWISA